MSKEKDFKKIDEITADNYIIDLSLEMQETNFYEKLQYDIDEPTPKNAKKLRRLISPRGGIFEYRKMGKLTYRKKPEDEDVELVCSHTPQILERSYTHNLSGDTRSVVRWRFNHPEAETLECSVSDLKNSRYLTEHAPHDVIVYNSSLLQEFLQLQSAGAELSHAYTYTGFIAGDEYCYVHSGGCITISKEHGKYSKLHTGETKTLEFYQVDNELAIMFLNRLFELSPVMVLLMMFMLLSLTYSKYRDKRPSFVFLLFGESGTFKSTISMFIFGVFKELYDVPPINLKIASLVSIHNMLCQFRDCVLLNDDGAPSANGNKEMSEKIESITRAYGDGIGRKVMKSVTEFHNMQPQGLSAITAEFQPLRDTSDMARALLYELKPDDIDCDDLSVITEERNIYIRVITDYINWICQNGDAYIYDMEEYFYDGREKYEKHCKIHSRLPENYGWMSSAFKTFLKFATEMYGIDKATKKRWKKIFGNGLKKSIHIQTREMQNVDEADLFLSTVRQMLISGQAHLGELRKGEHNKQISAINAKTIGHYDDKYVYLLPDEAYGLTNKWLHGLGQGYSLPKEAIQAKLDNRGLILRPNKKRVRYKLVINGSRQYFLRMNKSIFFPD